MNDYYTAQNVDISGVEYAPANPPKAMGPTTGQIASALRVPEPPRTAMSVLGIILDQTQKLISVSNELAVRINGAVPEKGEACGESRVDPMSNLNAAINEVQQNLNRAEQNLARALNGI